MLISFAITFLLEFYFIAMFSPVVSQLPKQSSLRSINFHGVSSRSSIFSLLSSSSMANISIICPGLDENRRFSLEFQWFKTIFTILRMIQPVSSGCGSGRSLDCLFGKLRHTGQSISLVPVRRVRYFQIHHPVQRSFRGSQHHYWSYCRKVLYQFLTWH